MTGFIGTYLVSGVPNPEAAAPGTAAFSLGTCHWFLGSMHL
jgi:hypothetical protein